ncbi:bile acid-CoA:amino acid N-acyltransferase-like [Orbicella faveolata]|uniref:bile acid-CoA:amino acid N-acyltransferase-like n=1 Tax=Orbicella faveolata TaxID=48498 RepID=UPI0009E1A9C5|nr:bile acid-CoA:amino acid N-acyltransferase-like [Orbicella faveolata]
MLNLRPKSSLIDKITKINVSQLKPLQNITLGAQIVGDKGETFESHAYFIADKDGEVDVCRDSSLGGSYSGVSPMGLLWSMKPAPGQRKGIRLMKSDVTKPYNIVLNCFDDHVTPNESSLQPLSSVTFQKWHMAEGVKRIPVREGRIRGTLFLPPGDGPFPGVIEMLGGTGGLWEFKASLLASHGFAALALAYLSYDDIHELPSSMDMEYFEEAANWLSSHPKVLPHGIGVHAICYGSWAALLMASLGMKAVKALVAISPVINAFPIPFSYKGKVSEILPFENSQKISTKEGSIWRYAIPAVNDVSTPVSNYSPITPVENISCPVLLAYGTGDLNVGSDFATELIFNRLKAHGKERLCSILRYPEAGHLIEPPYTPHCYSSFSGITAKWSGDHYLVWGGEMNAHAKAQEDAWPKILRFLRINLQHSSNL